MEFYDQQYLEAVKRMAGAGIRVHLVLGDSLRRQVANGEATKRLREMPQGLRDDISKLATSTLEMSEFCASRLVCQDNADQPKSVVARIKSGC